MAEYAVRYDKEARAYYVTEINNDGDDLSATGLFASLRDAERYKAACEGGKETYRANYLPPAPDSADQTSLPARPVATPKVERSSSGLRNALFDELDAIRSGASTPQRAKAVATLAAQIVDVVKMEMEIAKHAGDSPLENSLPKIPL
jgi:hypothetical protein